LGPRLAVLRKARGLTQIQLAEATGSAQRPISYYENDDGVPPVSTDKLLGLKTPKAAPAHEEDSETRRLWKSFQVVTQLPEKDQRAVIRLMNPLAAVTPRRNSIEGERNGR
jgi:transcriptional regulator with XRE-family HTH domain